MSGTQEDRSGWAGRTSRVVDLVLDRSVVLGYTRIGYHVRRRWWGPDPRPDALRGKQVLVTGATSGIGQALAAALGSLGATVHVLGHDEAHLDEAVGQLTTEAPEGQFVPELCDLEDLEDVRRFGRTFAERVPVLHALAHNAGTMAHERSESPQGHERTLAVHVLAPFLLTGLLTDSLAREGDARVVFTSSGGMYAAALRDDDPEYRQGKYSGPQAYARTKRMQVVLAEELAVRLADSGIAVHSMHPGWVDTRGVKRYLPKFRALTLPFMRTPEQGADTLVWLIAGDAHLSESGGFWHDRRTRPTSYGRPRRQTAEQRRRLLAFCADATRPA